MKIYTREYGWVRAKGIVMWLRWLALCSWLDHIWCDLGDPCWCGSDNCFECAGCGYQSHD